MQELLWDRWSLPQQERWFDAEIVTKQLFLAPIVYNL